MEDKYAIGLDFGSLSVRAVMVNTANGKEIARSVIGYHDAVIDTMLPDSTTPLPGNYALQNPQNYIDAVVSILRDVREKSEVAPEAIIGIGIDTTCSTVIPLDDQYEPLCFHPEFRNNPHSWLKMWKHHSTQGQADRINQLAAEHNEAFLGRCGGKMSGEWYYAKVLETIEEAPEIADAAAYFVELCDWIYYLLTGKKERCSLATSIHALWSSETGYPSYDFFYDVHPKLAEVMERNRCLPVRENFVNSSYITDEIAAKTGLSPHTAVSMGNTDSSVALLSLGVLEEGDIALILGTSSVLQVLSRTYHYIPGASASVKDHLMPGYYGNAFGQSAVGDIFDWFVNNYVPHRYFLEAQKNDESIFDVMNRMMDGIAPGSCGIVALDWFGGCRSLLNRTDLAGVLVGMTLATKPEEIYCSLVESTAFGLREILNAISAAHIPVNNIYACGGLTKKSPEIMQKYADILNIPIYTTASSQAIACGSAILGALAAGSAAGGYDTIADAVKAMRCPIEHCYEPRPQYRAVYDRLFHTYKTLHDYFGKSNSTLMKELRYFKSSPNTF